MSPLSLVAWAAAIAFGGMLLGVAATIVVSLVLDVIEEWRNR